MNNVKPLLRRVALAAAVALGGATVAPLPTLASGTSDAAVAPWDAAATYDTAGQRVSYRASVDGVLKQGIFVNAWWTRGDAPSFVGTNGPWKIVGTAQIVDGSGGVSAETTPPWYAATAYSGGAIVAMSTPAGTVCYKAKYWTQGFNPTTAVTHEWETPWEKLASCPDGTTAPPVTTPPGEDIDHLPPQDPVTPEVPGGTPVVPPVMPTVPPPSPEVAPPGDVGSTLPAEGYAFLRQVGAADWDWLFPLRSGKYDTQGGTRNMEPIARPDGSTDTFTLPAFRRAVLEYNGWAKANNYKQFLNEGTLKQQSQEFLVFWAKSARETSGSWQGAPAPWIRDYIDRGGRVTQVWKGALYWVEEVGYTSNADGTSPNIGYVDSGSVDFPPVPGRSYHGRGVIQLSWNYNYGAFSRWLYDSGLMRDVITAPDTLLKRPDLVATNGALSILSGIWFWMTPQGQKPSSHDVLYGDVINISQNSNDRGLPQLRSGLTVAGKPTGPVMAGDTTDEGVMAFRIGTIINIVNGGLECNGAATWHPGPPQRISYYNAYTTYFNEKPINPGATRVSVATNIWNDKISTSSPEAAQSATCFNQKSYYGW